MQVREETRPGPKKASSIVPRQQQQQLKRWQQLAMQWKWQLQIPGSSPWPFHPWAPVRQALPPASNLSLRW